MKYSRFSLAILRSYTRLVFLLVLLTLTQQAPAQIKFNPVGKELTSGCKVKKGGKAALESRGVQIVYGNRSRK